MTPRCAHCYNTLTQDEADLLGNNCECCEEKLRRRWDDRYAAQPSKFAQRVAIVLAIAIIFACVVGMNKLGGG